VLSVGGRGDDHVGGARCLGGGCHRRRMRLRQRMVESLAVHRVHDHAVLGQLLRGPRDVLSDHHRLDLRPALLRELLGRAQRMESRLLQLALRLLRHHQDRRHQITFASACSFCTSVWTSGTLTPAARCGGGSTLITFTFGVTSTPSAWGVSSAIGFFFAFMMLGNDAYRGTLSRRSTVTIAGSCTSSTSRPP